MHQASLGRSKQFDSTYSYQVEFNTEKSHYNFKTFYFDLAAILKVSWESHPMITCFTTKNYNFDQIRENKTILKGKEQDTYK